MFYYVVVSRRVLRLWIQNFANMQTWSHWTQTWTEWTWLTAGKPWVLVGKF